MVHILRFFVSVIDVLGNILKSARVLTTRNPHVRRFNWCEWRGALAFLISVGLVDTCYCACILCVLLLHAFRLALIERVEESNFQRSFYFCCNNIKSRTNELQVYHHVFVKRSMYMCEHCEESWSENYDDVHFNGLPVENRLDRRSYVNKLYVNVLSI